MSVGAWTGGMRGPLQGGRVAGAGLAAAPALAAVTALTGLGAVLRFWGLGHQGFWYDEADTALLVHLSLGKMLGLLPQSESTPPLYYIVAWIWGHVFGEQEAGVRSLSALTGTLVIPVAYAAGGRLISPRAGVIAAALTACNPFLIWYSQEARAYSMLILLTAVTLLAFAHVRERPSGRGMALWAVAGGLALATHYFALVAVVPEAIWLLAVHPRDRRVRLGIGFVVTCGLALLPLAITQNGTRRDSWIAHAPFGMRLRQILPQFLIGTNAPHRLVVKYLAMALTGVALGLLAFRATAAERGGALVAGGLAAGGFLLALVFVAAGFDDLITRNIIDLWLPAALMVAGGLAVRGARWLGGAVAVGLCAIGVFATIGIITERSLQRPDWRYVARALGAGPGGGASGAGTAGGAGAAGAGRAILVQHYTYLLPLSLYLPRLREFHAPERVSQIDVISVVSPSQPLCWWGAACNLIPSAMQRRYDIAGFHTVSRRHVLQWTLLTMRARRPVLLTRSDVARALHATSLRRDELIYQPG